MAKISSLVAKLQTKYPHVAFAMSDDFYWSSADKTVYVDCEATDQDSPVLLHELAHALLGHDSYRRDIELIRIEREAWELATTKLAPQFAVPIDTDLVEEMIDTYRDWLHARSTCPLCSMTGVQSASMRYHCVGCDHNWNVNEARRCQLRRYSLSPN